MVAGQGADEMLDCHDAEGQLVWKRIRRAIAALEAAPVFHRPEQVVLAAAGEGGDGRRHGQPPELLSLPSGGAVVVMLALARARERVAKPISDQAAPWGNRFP